MLDSCHTIFTLFVYYEICFTKQLVVLIIMCMSTLWVNWWECGCQRLQWSFYHILKQLESSKRQVISWMCLQALRMVKLLRESVLRCYFTPAPSDCMLSLPCLFSSLIWSGLLSSTPFSSWMMAPSAPGYQVENAAWTLKYSQGFTLVVIRTSHLHCFHLYWGWEVNRAILIKLQDIYMHQNFTLMHIQIYNQSVLFLS